jgi:hypothetical protein
MCCHKIWKYKTSLFSSHFLLFDDLINNEIAIARAPAAIPATKGLITTKYFILSYLIHTA